MKVGCGIMKGEDSERRLYKELKRSRCCVVSLQRLLPHLARFRLRAHRWLNGMWHMDLSSRRRSTVCPNCRHRSSAVHSLYRRTVADLPLAGATLVLHLQVRRFFCRHTTVHSGLLPSGFRPSSRSVAATVGAYVRSSGTWAWRLAAARGCGSRAHWAYQAVFGQSCVWSMVRPTRSRRSPG
jgi:hypothetical protein